MTMAIFGAFLQPPTSSRIARDLAPPIDTSIIKIVRIDKIYNDRLSKCLGVSKLWFFVPPNRGGFWCPNPQKKALDTMKSSLFVHLEKGSKKLNHEVDKLECFIKSENEPQNFFPICQKKWFENLNHAAREAHGTRRSKRSDFQCSCCVVCQRESEELG